jgi:hypothetical protein
MANKITTQSGREITAVGNDGSHIRNKEQFDVTFPKLMEVIKGNKFCSNSELVGICRNDKVPDDKIYGLISTVNFYLLQPELL